jgi:hypothetical protein
MDKLADKMWDWLTLPLSLCEKCPYRALRILLLVSMIPWMIFPGVIFATFALICMFIGAFVEEWKRREP